MKAPLCAAFSLAILCLGQQAQTLPNPASKHCIQLGGRLLMEKDVKGVYGICVFDHNQQCEEWALFRGDCPVGGIDITGYTTRESVFCAIRGGKVVGNETQCQLPSGQVCPIKDFYARKCPSQG